jgi:predicted small lipoprotein YifL
MRGVILVAASTKLVMKQYSLIMLILSLITLVLSSCGGKGPLPPADTTSPSISLTSPTNGAQNVSVNSSITITFSEAMDASTINEQTITLSMGTGNVPGSATYSDTTAVFKPASSLNPGTIYTVTVDGGVKDVAGNAMVTPFGYIFITGTALSPTTMSLSAPGVTYGANGIVTVTVSSAAGTPTGNVSLSVDGGTAVVQDLTGGSTTFTIPSPSAGTHTLNAEYAAQGNFEASSASGTLVVGVGATTMSLSAPGVTYGANGIVTVTVSSAAGTPTGNVSLSVDGGAATTQGLINGSSTFTIPSPSAGSHTLNAAYAEQGTFGASSRSGSLIVIRASTSTEVTSSLNPSTSGDLVTFTATVTPSIATGTVTFKDDKTVLGTDTLSGGVAKLSTSALSVASHSITAVYSGDTNFAASTSSTLTQTVKKRPH